MKAPTSDIDPAALETRQERGVEGCSVRLTAPISHQHPTKTGERTGVVDVEYRPSSRTLKRTTLRGYLATFVEAEVTEEKAASYIYEALRERLFGPGSQHDIHVTIDYDPVEGVEETVRRGSIS